MTGPPGRAAPSGEQGLPRPGSRNSARAEDEPRLPPRRKHPTRHVQTRAHLSSRETNVCLSGEPQPGPRSSSLPPADVLRCSDDAVWARCSQRASLARLPVTLTPQRPGELTGARTPSSTGGAPDNRAGPWPKGQNTAQVATGRTGPRPQRSAATPGFRNRRTLPCKTHPARTARCWTPWRSRAPGRPCRAAGTRPGPAPCTDSTPGSPRSAPGCRGLLRERETETDL